MKNWLTIGQFAEKASVSQKALRVYEQAGLLKPHARGENNYRYYSTDQLELLKNIKSFKSLGFTLSEIRSMLDIDEAMNPKMLRSFLEKRLQILELQQSENLTAQAHVRKILSSLKQNKKGLEAQERRFIMAQLEKLSVVVTGVSGLELTAHFIQHHIANSGKQIPVSIWDGKSALPTRKPYVLVIPEEHLMAQGVSSLEPDVVVIKELSKSAPNIQTAYTNLYGAVGPHMSTILNADDRAVVELAGQEVIRKGKTYYFSKNAGLKSQISKIGGVVSDGEAVEIYGMNQSPGPVEINLQRVMGYQEEMAYLASLAAVMDLGLNREALDL